MDQETQNKIEELNRKIDAIYLSVEKTRKYFFWTMVVTLVVFVLPLIGLVFVIPSFFEQLHRSNKHLGRIDSPNKQNITFLFVSAGGIEPPTLGL
jgi:predicted ferric reductase